MRIAFFDFDGTITKADSTARFIRYLVGDSKFFIGIFFLLPFMFLYILNIISNNSIKQILITYFFKGKSIDEFKKHAEYFSLNMLETLIRKKALKEIEWHKENGHDVVIVSASIDLWLRPWCIKNDVALISSMLEVNDNVSQVKQEIKTVMV